MNKVILFIFCAVIATAYSKNVDAVEKPVQGIGLCLVEALQGILDCVQKNPPAEEPQNFSLCILKEWLDYQVSLRPFKCYKKIIIRTKTL
ncbi:unnamed protein product [Leptidea sinapis]|uniref:Saposin B-type domain-containing protein n=1 Tax=Leptidea sinapis TaxID=189913 RepID=A0A5E4QQM4_9NEOP|nr:unnamed protein product [Leptidea sinapis]